MDTEEKIFNQEYERTLGMLKQRSEAQGFDLETVKQELSYLEIYEGQDWTGRGELKHAEISAQILAYQVFIRRLSDLREDIR